MVNLVGYGFKKIYIGNLSTSKKSVSNDARVTLEEANIITFEEMKI
jgi:hypothetical protein